MCSSEWNRRACVLLANLQIVAERKKKTKPKFQLGRFLWKARVINQLVLAVSWPVVFGDKKWKTQTHSKKFVSFKTTKTIKNAFRLLLSYYYFFYIAVLFDQFRPSFLSCSTRGGEVARGRREVAPGSSNPILLCNCSNTQPKVMRLTGYKARSQIFPVKANNVSN